MKNVMILLGVLLCSSLSFAQPLSCAVTKIAHSTIFNGGLNQVDNGDEDYAYIEFNEKESTIKVGGFSFPNYSADTVTVQKPNDGLTVVLVNAEYFGQFKWEYHSTSGRSYLVSIDETGKETFVAEANCLYDLGINPFDPPPIAWH